MDGLVNAQRFQAWAGEVHDFKPYVHQGVLSVARMARECGLKRDVFYTNTTIRDCLLPELIRTLEDSGILRSRVAQPAQVLILDGNRSPVSNARLKQTQEENAALKAENEELRLELRKFQGMADVLHSTGRLPW